MTRRQIPNRRIETQYIKYSGGIDRASPVLSLRPGNALDAMNYEPGLLGGYRRIDGFERVDGRPAPSSATYTYLEGVLTATIALGATLTGATSGATGVVVKVDIALGAVCITKAVGDFVSGENILVGAAVVGHLTIAPAPRGYRDVRNDAMALAAAADAYRSDIGAVPGEGPVRGTWMYHGILYAFRDAVGGATCAMFKATAGGWVNVPLGDEVSFTNANVSVGEGDTLTSAGGVTATIMRVVLETGTLASGTNSGRLILSGRTGGDYLAQPATTTGGGTLSISATQTPIELLPGGRYEFVNTNFAGSTATQRMYGADGVNHAFEFDGTAFVPIHTGMTLDAPKFITEHKKKLFLAFQGSVQYSGDGEPYRWTVLAGANEIGMGDEITGFAVQSGDTLAIFTRNMTYQLNGSTSNSFNLLPISKEIGGIAYTVQVVGKTYAMDDRGIILTVSVQQYGNFQQSVITGAVQKIIDKLRTQVVGSMVYRNRNQMRVYGADGSGIILTFSSDQLVGVTELQYPLSPTCFASCEDGSGKDVVFFGAADGFVYQADSGSSFDGADIEAYLRMPFNNIGAPRMRKRFNRAVMEMSAEGYAQIRFQPEFSYGDPDVSPHRLQTLDVNGAGGYWDVNDWNDFFYDARLVSTPEFSIEGSGVNMAMLFYSSSSFDLGHVLQGATIHFAIKRLTR